VRVTVEKLPGVQSARVSLNEGRMVVDLARGNSVSLAQIRRSVERNGFTPREATVRARVEVIAEDESMRVNVLGLDERYEVVPTADASDIRQQLAGLAGKTVVVEGVVPAAPNEGTPPSMRITNVGAAGKAREAGAQ
jgi:hypothetical protein